MSTSAPRLYRLMLHALPTPFRRRNGGDMAAVVAARLDEIRRRDGHAAYWRRVAAEMVDLVSVAFTLRVAAGRKSAPVGEERSSMPNGPLYEITRELRSAARALLRRPGFTAAATVTLALGISGATTMFGVLDAIIVRPLPYPDSDRLTMVWRTVPKYGFTRSTISYPDYLDWRQSASAFSQIAAYARGAGTLLIEGPPERIAGARVTGSLFTTLGNAPAVGRVIGADDDRPDAERVLLLSDALWRRRFAADSTVVGRVIALGEDRYRVIGVMPRDFAFPSPATEYWVALRANPATAERDANYLTAIGRLRTGVTIGAAQAQMEGVIRGIASAHPNDNVGTGVRVESRREFIVGPVRRVVFVLAGASALLLAIACANLANLQLVRATARRRELAVRAALGAGRGRLARAMIAEGVVLAVVGGALGAVIATAATRALVKFGPESIPRRSELAVDARALAFAFGASLVCAVLCAVWPAISSARRAPGDALAQAMGSDGRAIGERATRRAQDGLIVMQVALALVLLVGASLLARSLHRLTTVPVGFDGSRVLTAHIALPQQRYGAPPRVQAFYGELLTRASAIPGVEVASGTWALPFGDDFASGTLVPRGAAAGQKYPTVANVPVRDGYFRSVGATLLHGRAIDARDDANSPPVAVVNETLARAFWPGEAAVGQQIIDPDEPNAPITVVGVVADLRSRSLDAVAEPEMYQPHAQAGWAGGSLYLTLRVSGDPLAAAPALREAVWAIDPTLPVTRVGVLSDFVSSSAAAPRFRTLVIVAFASLAALLAVVGIGAVMAYAVAQRTREIGVRMALGAASSRVLRSFVARGLALTGAGFALGVAGAIAATGVLRTLLFEVTPLDPLAYLIALVALGGAAVVAAWFPARRAARVDPIVALRD